MLGITRLCDSPFLGLLNMDVTLIIKEDAGEGDQSAKKLTRMLEDAGHTVNTCHRKDDWARALDAQPDVVLIGGGDGTVGKVARRLLGTGIPFSILPLGTANNVATQLGLDRSPESIIEGLAEARRVPFDVGQAAGPWGTWHFIEAVGLGPFARTMAMVKRLEGDAIKEPSSRKKILNRDLGLLGSAVLDSPLDHLCVDLDDRRHDDAFLMFEVLNIGLIGPNVRLSPDADTADGLFDVVLASDADRPGLHRYLAARTDGDDATVSLPIHRVREIRVSVEGTRIHIDDELWPPEEEAPPAASTSFEVHLTMLPGALSVLLPQE